MAHPATIAATASVAGQAPRRQPSDAAEPDDDRDGQTQEARVAAAPRRARHAFSLVRLRRSSRPLDRRRRESSSVLASRTACERFPHQVVEAADKADDDADRESPRGSCRTACRSSSRRGQGRQSLPRVRARHRSSGPSPETPISRHESSAPHTPPAWTDERSIAYLVKNFTSSSTASADSANACRDSPSSAATRRCRTV